MDFNGFNPNAINYGFGGNPAFTSGDDYSGGYLGGDPASAGTGLTDPLNPVTVTPSLIDAVKGLGSGGGGGMFGNNPGQFGFNMPTFNLALGSLNTLGGLWAAMNAAGVAKQQLAFTKQVTNANLANQTKSYNTALSDRIGSRAVAENLNPAAVQDYIAKNSLKTPTIG